MTGRADPPGPPGLMNNGPIDGFADGFRVNAMSKDAFPGFSQSSGTFMVAHSMSSSSAHVSQVIVCCAYTERSSPRAAGSSTEGTPLPL